MGFYGEAKHPLIRPLNQIWLGCLPLLKTEQKIKSKDLDFLTPDLKLAMLRSRLVQIQHIKIILLIAFASELLTSLFSVSFLWCRRFLAVMSLYNSIKTYSRGIFHHSWAPGKSWVSLCNGLYNLGFITSVQPPAWWYIDIDISNNPVCRIFSTHIFHITRLSFLDVLPCQAFYDYRFSNIKVGKPNSGVWHFTGEKLIRFKVKKEKWWNFHLIKVSFSIIFINS